MLWILSGHLWLMSSPCEASPTEGRLIDHHTAQYLSPLETCQSFHIWESVVFVLISDNNPNTCGFLSPSSWCGNSFPLTINVFTQGETKQVKFYWYGTIIGYSRKIKLTLLLLKISRYPVKLIERFHSSFSMTVQLWLLKLFCTKISTNTCKAAPANLNAKCLMVGTEFNTNQCEKKQFTAVN